MIKEKTSQIACEAQLEVTAILPGDGAEDRARELLRNAALAYRGYDNPAAARFKAGKVRPAIPVTEPFPPAWGLLQARNVLGARELAALWHPLGGGDQLAGVPRSGARVLHPTAKAGSGGAYVGDTASGRPQKIHFQEDTLHGHHFYVARTRMGKSTLMLHIVKHLLLEKAAGRNDDAIIVVDPHADLVKDLLHQVPESILDSVCFIDLADDGQAPGINLLDTRVFPDRDRTADSVVRVAHGLWEQWGPRMQSILEHTVKSLHEYHCHPDTGEDEQLTILDGSRMLSDRKFRNRVLLRVADPYIVSWWGGVFLDWTRTIQTEAISPVQTRLAYYSSSKKARAILRQRRSTLDIREVIAGGGVLLVSTAQGDVGRDVSALVGASLLNLVDAVIREQGRLPPGPAQGRPGGGGRDVVHPRRRLRVHAQRTWQVRRQLHAGHLEPGPAGRPVPHHAGHPAGQRGLPGGVPSGGLRRPPAHWRAGPGPGQRGGPGVAAGAPLLRAGHGGRAARAHLLPGGSEARAGGPGGGGTGESPGLGLHHLGGDVGLPGRRGGASGEGVPGPGEAGG